MRGKIIRISVKVYDVTEAKRKVIANKLCKRVVEVFEKEYPKLEIDADVSVSR